MNARLLACLLLLAACGNSGKTVSTECKALCQDGSKQITHGTACRFDGEQDTATQNRVEAACETAAEATGTCAKPDCTCTLLDQTAPKDCSE